MNGRVPEGGEVVLIADELSRAVELTLNPAVAHEARNQAYNACESFKENSPWCAQAGLLLASGAQYSAVVQHFGLQLMEHTVKYRWTQITQAEKIFIKENAMKLLYLGGWETGHLNDALSRVIVEMIKREWPQQWPTLLSELSDACTQGHVHTQIVLHVFLRLVEDVATLQTLEQNQRRKDIYQALMSNMAEILAFFMRLTELHVQEFREKTAAGDYAGAASNGRVVQTVLQTLAGFAEVVPAALLVAERGLLRALCLLLLQDAFRLLAADALLQLLNRKGSVKERKPLLVLFNEDAISCVHRAALDNVNKPNEENYTFLKKLSQVVVGLAALAAALWAQAAAADAAAAGAWLRALLQAVLLLAAQPALAVAQAAAAAAAALLRHEALLRHDALAAAAPHWLAAAAPKLLKLPFPGAPDAAFYARLDYDNEHDYNLFFSRFRTEVLDTFRYCMMAAPLVTWGFMEQWAHAALDKLDAHAAHAAHDAHELSLEWEALTLAVETATSRLLACEPRPAAGGGLALLARVLRCEPAAAALRSLLLSLLSALVVFLSCAGAQLAPADVAGAGADLLPRVLDKIFAALVFEGAPPEDRRSRSVKNVRRHAASLLVKLGAKYPLLLLPVFPRLHELCRAAAARADLSVLESVTVQEALLLVSNHLCCFERQARLVGELLGDSRARWEALAPHVGSARPLLQLLGLDAAAAPSAGDAQAQARRTLLYELTLLLAVVKRTQVPADPDKAARGGFGGGVTESGNPVWRNPCADHVLPLLPHALALLRSLHALHEPAVAALLHADHARVLLPPAAERLGLLGGAGGGAGGAGAGGEAGPAERVQGYVHALHEAACALAGAAAGALGRALYAAPGAGGALAAVLLPGELPDAWLRRVLRGALKPLLARCPAPLQRAVAVPLLAHAAPLLLQHLTRRWDYVAALYHDGKLDDAASESQEVLDDILVRHLTREYVDLLKVALVDVGGVVESNSCEMEEEGVGGGARPAEQVSELGALLLAHADTSAWLLHGVLRALTWGDSAGSLRAAALALPALRAALAAGRLAAGDAAAALAAALQALRAHGQHDANLAALLALALHSYELLRPRFPAVAAVLRAVPGADLADLQRLDDKLAATDTTHPARTHKQDKTKRELFKKITSKLIGRNVGQLFKKEVLIVDLPAMPAPGKEPARSALDADAHLDRLFATNAPT